MNDEECDADKRAHHNALQQKRRDGMKLGFTSLRDAVPALHGEESTQLQILKKATEYIQSTRRRNAARQQDIEHLKQQNKLHEEQILALEKTRMIIDGGPSTGSGLGAMNIKADSIPAPDGGSGSESSEGTHNCSRDSQKKTSSLGSTRINL